MALSFAPRHYSPLLPVNSSSSGQCRAEKYSSNAGIVNRHCRSEGSRPLQSEIGWGLKKRGSTHLLVLLHGSRTPPFADVSKSYSRQGAARASSSAEVSTSGSTENVKSQSLQEQKAAILRAVANTDRGKNTTPRQRKHILDLIETVERQNPTLDPIKSPLISGTWSLLYTASTKEEFTYAGTEEGPFLARVKPAAFGQVNSKGSTQIIQSETGHVDNIAEFSVFEKPGSLTITGSFAPAAPLPDRGAVRIDVRFEKFTLKLGTINLQVPLGWVNPTGWIDTTYLDSELRIGRGDKGSVFVTVRRK